MLLKSLSWLYIFGSSFFFAYLITSLIYKPYATFPVISQNSFDTVFTFLASLILVYFHFLQGLSMLLYAILTFKNKSIFPKNLFFLFLYLFIFSAILNFIRIFILKFSFDTFQLYGGNGPTTSQLNTKNFLGKFGIFIFIFQVILPLHPCFWIVKNYQKQRVSA